MKSLIVALTDGLAEAVEEASRGGVDANGVGVTPPDGVPSGGAFLLGGVTVVVGIPLWVGDTGVTAGVIA